MKKFLLGFLALVFVASAFAEQCKEWSGTAKTSIKELFENKGYTDAEIELFVAYEKDYGRDLGFPCSDQAQTFRGVQLQWDHYQRLSKAIANETDEAKKDVLRKQVLRFRDLQKAYQRRLKNHPGATQRICLPCSKEDKNDFLVFLGTNPEKKGAAEVPTSATPVNKSPKPATAH